MVLPELIAPVLVFCVQTHNFCHMINLPLFISLFKILVIVAGKICLLVQNLSVRNAYRSNPRLLDMIAGPNPVGEIWQPQISVILNEE